MRYARMVRAGAFAMMATGVVGSGIGCTHNYYYPSPAGYAPGVVSSPSTMSYGEVCEVPTQVVGGSQVVTARPVVVGTPIVSRPAPIGSDVRPPRVVLSEPGRRMGRGLWHRPDPENSPATTRIDGALDDPSMTR